MDTELEDLSTRELGGFLVTNRAAIDAAEARWLEAMLFANDSTATNPLRIRSPGRRTAAWLT